MSKPNGAWARALHLAEQTPESRNRYVDLLRAIAISCVVLGHWTMADGERRSREVARRPITG